MKQEIIELYNNPPEKWTAKHKALFAAFIDALNKGEIRSCEKEKVFGK